VKSVQIVLASTSPRRIELMSQVGYQTIRLKPDVDETVIRGETARSMVKRLSVDKAQVGVTLLDELQSDYALVLSADTTVVQPGGTRVIGKPETRDEAIKMVGRLAGRTHQVLTGYSLFLCDRERRVVSRHTRVVRTLVKMRKLTRAQVEAYVDSGESMDKAGAYGAQGRGMTLIQEIRGSYTNVVGLPMAEVCEDIERILKSIRGTAVSG
jgi:septum formation protein